ncbi:MAG: DNA polymerase III subunit delta [Flavobacteriales bacterium]|nr:DNA polymerase III subunit delta [Flavobacteriales bacterium]
MSTIEQFKKIQRDVRAGAFKPVYLLHGEESFYIDRTAAEIEANALQEHERDFNLTVFYGKDTDPDTVKDACLRFPMMAERQLVVLREANAWKIDVFDKLVSYFSSPTPTTILVICYKYKKVDGRRSWLKELAKKGVVFASDKLRDDQLPDWIRKYAAFHKRKLGMAEAMLLGEHLGSDLSKVAREVEKLCLVTPEGGSIGSDTIHRYVGISKDHNVFELQNAIGDRDRAKALRIAKYFAQDPKNHPLMMTLGVLNGYLTKVMVARTNAQRPAPELASMMKVPPFFLKDYQRAARNYDVDQLMHAQHLLRDCEMRAKGFGNNMASDGELLNELLVRVMDR